MNKTTNRVIKLIKPHFKTVILVTLIAIVINLGELAKPYLVKVLIDDFLTAGVYEKAGITITLIGMLYLFLVLITNILDLITNFMTNIMGEKVVFDLRNKLCKYIQRANISFHDKTSAGKLFVRITNDVEDVASLFKDVITTLFKDIIMIFAVVTIMLILNIKLSLISFSVLPFVFIFSYIINKALKKAYGKCKSLRTKVNSFLAESIYGLKLIKIFNRKHEKEVECSNLNKMYFNSRKITGFYEGLLPGLILILENIGIAIIVIVCSNKYFSTTLDVGLIYIFITYLRQLFAPITRIVENMETVQESVVSVDKIYDILENEEYIETIDIGKNINKVIGKIEFKNVWFAYDANNWILKDISFVINPKESTAFVGKTGSGKSTITNLINRFYEIQKGQILIDDIDIKDISIKSLRENIGIVLQDPFIFARSIKNNVKLNNKLSDLGVEMALKLASAGEFVKQLPNGIDEIAKERGNAFSTGQKQLLAFARIFAHDPSIFILDEATANIDTHTETLIQRAVDIISKKKTSIFIAHRLSTIVNVDKIIVLDDGKIVECGSHNELINNDGYYSELYNSYYAQLS